MFGKLTSVEWRFHHIARNLTAFDLQALEDGPAVDEQALFGELFGEAQASHFLGYYSHSGVEHALEAYGIMQVLRSRGYAELKLHLDLSDPFCHRLRLHVGEEPTPHTILLDFAARLGSARGLPLAGHPRDVRLLVIDWLLLQDPRAGNTGALLLPGQRYPGLGLGVEIAVLIGLIAKRLELDGCLCTPAWYHNAVLYSPRYTFVEPSVEGRFRALRRDGADLDLRSLSWALDLECVSVVERGPSDAQTSKPRPCRWTGRPQLWAHSKRLIAHFRAPAYKGVRDATENGVAYLINRAALERALQDLCVPTHTPSSD